MIEINFTGELQRIEKRPGDVWVLTCDVPIDDDTAQRLRSEFSKRIGDDVKIIVLDKHLRLSVVSDAD